MYQLNLMQTKTLEFGDHIAALEYYVMKEIKEDILSVTYGIMILKKEDKKIEMQYVSNLSYSREEVERIIEKLIQGTITPMVMLEVIDDLTTAALYS